MVQDGPTDYGKIKAMVEAGAVTWDVVDAEYDWALQAGKAGLLEPLDFTVIDKTKLDPRFVSDFAVGSFYYSFVLGWNPANFADAKPATLADLFDTSKFPGKRTFYKWSAPGVIEAALLADGVVMLGRRSRAGSPNLRASKTRRIVISRNRASVRLPTTHRSEHLGVSDGNPGLAPKG